MNKYRTSEEVIPDTRLTQVTRQTPVSESPNQPGILSNVKEAADSPQSDHCEVKFEEYYIGTEDESYNPPSKNEVQCQQANIRRLFRQRDNPQSCDPDTVPDSDWSGDMVSSIAFIVSKYRFTQDDYNDIMFMMSDMDSEGAIEPLSD